MIFISSVFIKYFHKSVLGFKMTGSKKIGKERWEAEGRGEKGKDRKEKKHQG